MLRVVFPEPVEVASLEKAIGLQLVGIAVRQRRSRCIVSVRPWHHHLGAEKAGLRESEAVRGNQGKQVWCWHPRVVT